MLGSVYVVLAIDTEGPVTDRKHSDLLSNWRDVDRFVASLCDDNYRQEVLDSKGNGLVISWFLLSWTGFTTNPVQREFGYHKIFDHYERQFGAEMRRFGDGIYWHYHHPSRSGVANEWNTDWSTSDEYVNVLNRLVIDRWYFPSVFRAGGAIETNEMSRWLEQWIPIDYSSRAASLDWDAVGESGGTRLRELSDWSRAPRDWTAYHPGDADYQRPGTMRRIIFRCPDLLTAVHAFSESDVELAFAQAAGGESVVLATFDHDYRERAELFTERLTRTVGRVAARHPEVTWNYASALDAAQAVFGWKSREGPVFELSRNHLDGPEVVIQTKRPLFGPMPYVVCHYPNPDEYLHVTASQDGDGRWLLSLPEAGESCVIGIASSDPFGNVGVSQYQWDGHRKVLSERKRE